MKRLTDALVFLAMAYVAVEGYLQWLHATEILLAIVGACIAGWLALQAFHHFGEFPTLKAYAAAFLFAELGVAACILATPALAFGWQNFLTLFFIGLWILSLVPLFEAHRQRVVQG